jgi:hypothetical protein
MPKIAKFKKSEKDLVFRGKPVILWLFLVIRQNRPREPSRGSLFYFCLI